jgi:hypothetical protein
MKLLDRWPNKGMLTPNFVSGGFTPMAKEFLKTLFRLSRGGI